MFFRKSPLYVCPLQWEEFNSILVFSKVYMLKSSCLGKGPWLNLPTSHSFNAFWLTFTVRFTVASHACVQTYRHAIILCQSPNPNKICSKPWCTCLLYLPVKSCSSSHRAQPSSCPVTALSVVSVGQLAVCCIFLQHVGPAYMKPSHGGLFQQSLAIWRVFLIYLRDIMG